MENEIDKLRRLASLRTMVGLGIVALLAQMGWATLNFSALPMWVQFDLDQGQYLGVILGAFMLTEALLRPSLGALSDRVGRKPLMLAGPAMGVFTSIATIYLTHPLLMVLLRAIDGVGLAAFWPAAFAAAGDAVEEKYRSTAMSVVNGTGMAGIALGMPLGGLANDLSHSHTGAFYFVSFIFLFTFLVGMVIFPREAHKHEHVEHAEERRHLPDKAEVASVIHLVPDMLVVSVVIFTAIGLLMPIVKLYAVNQLAMSETQFGVMVAPVAAALGLLSVPFGRFADKWGKLVSVCYGLLICTFGMWLIATIPRIWVLAGASALVGVGFALAFPAWMAVVSQAAPSDRRGQVMGAVGLAQGIGAIIGVEIGPFIYSSDWMSLPRFGVVHFNLPFYMCAVLLSASTYMAFTWVSKVREQQSGGRWITWRERRAITAAALIGAVVIAGWVVLRYTRPLPADRVAWLWVQAAVHNDPRRAERYTLPSFEQAASAGRTASETASAVYSRWVKTDKASYTLRSPSLSEHGRRAEVRLVFQFLDGHKAQDVIVLARQESGEWKVARRYSRRPEGLLPRLLAARSPSRTSVR